MDIDYTGKIERDVEIIKDTVVTGMIVGNVEVHKGATLTLRGMVIGKITVRAGAKLDVPGTLIGEVIDQGGDIVTTGMVIDSV